MRWFPVCAVFAVVALLLASAMSAVNGDEPVESRAESSAGASEYERAWVQRDGSVSAELYSRPFRARSRDGWVPIDTALTVRPDGVIVPRAVAADVEFSPGGDGPLVRLAGMALSWPSALPKPVITGDTVTYPEALPGVDVGLTARSAGFTLTLTVRAPVEEFRLAGTGIRAGPQGTVVANAVQAGAVRAEDSGGADVTAVRGVQDETLIIRLDRRALGAAWTRFPVHVAQDFSVGDWSWMLVEQDADGYQARWRPSGKARAGLADEREYRSYIELNTGRVRGAQVLGATLRIPACVSAEVWQIGEFGPATSWTGTEYRRLLGETECGELDVTALLAQAAARSWSRVSVAVVARQGQAATEFDAPSIAVRYR